MRPGGLLPALALAIALSSTAEAVAPRAEWRTIVTPRFRVHFHEGGEALARRLAHEAERALEALAIRLGHLPDDPIHVVVADDVDAANGFARAIPYNHVSLLAGLPDPFGALGDYGDFMRLLLVHELVHVVHLDTAPGIPAAVNRVLGKTYLPNSVQPRWVLEGLAVWLESELTGFGRIHSAYVDALVRAQILAGTFPAIDEVTTLMRRWPKGQVAHLFGGRFVDFVARRHGAEAWAAISHGYGRRVLPWGLNIVAREATGEDFVEMWSAWIAEERAKADQLLGARRAEGLRLGRARAFEADEILSPRYLPDGRLAVFAIAEDRDPVLAVEGFAPIRAPIAGGAPLGETRFVGVVQDAVALRFSYRDLEILDLTRGTRRRRTFGARLSEPDVRDGRIVAVGQRLAENALYTLSADGEDPPALAYAPPEGSDVSAPRWSPDGARVAVSVSNPGAGRAIAIIDLASGASTSVTDGVARDLAPEWSPDGRFVYFASDRGGVFDIHRVASSGGPIERITRVETGAFQPAAHPDGRRLAFTHATADGWEVREIEIEPAPAEAATARRVVSATVSATVDAVEAYSPWESLQPAAWVPTFGVDGEGSTFGVAFAGEDALGRHQYGVRVDGSTSTRRVGYAIGYANRAWVTPIRLSSSLVHGTLNDRFVSVERRRKSVFRVGLGVDLSLGRWDGGHGLSASWGWESRRPIDPVDDDPLQPIPGEGPLDLSHLSLVWRFSTVRGYDDSISSAAGAAMDLGLRWLHPLIGSDLAILEISAHGSAFVRLPWLRHHVLAARTSLATSLGDAGPRGVFSLGGLPSRNVLADFVDGVSFGVDHVRGYGPAVVSGPSLYLASVEYRLPILTVERGIDTLPLFFDRIHGAVFVDAGDTPRAAWSLDALRVGAGAELRASLVLGYFLRLEARLGYARGLTLDGIDNVYLVLGSSF